MSLINSWGISDKELESVIENGNSFLQEAFDLAKQKLTTTHYDSLPPTPRVSGDIALSAYPHCELTWMVKVKRKNQKGNQGYQLGNRDGVDANRLFVLRVDPEILPSPQLMDVGDEVVEMNKNSPSGRGMFGSQNNNEEVELRLTAKSVPESRLRTLLSTQTPVKKAIKYHHDVIIVHLEEQLTEKSEENEDVNYQYSQAIEMEGAKASVLMRIKGALLTINQQLQNVLTKDRAVSMTVHVDDETVNIVFHLSGNHMVLFAASEHITSANELLTSSTEAMKTLLVLHRNIPECVGSTKESARLDVFFSSFFAKFGDATSTVDNRFGHASYLACNPSLCLEVTDILDLLETKCVNNPSSRPDEALPVASCLFSHQKLVWSHFNETDLDIVGRICRQYIFNPSSAEITGFTYTACFRVYGSSVESDDCDVYLVITSLGGSTLCLMVRCWRDDGVSGEKGVGAAQIHDAELRLHMLSVNGTLGRLKAVAETPKVELYEKGTKHENLLYRYIDGLSGVMAVGADAQRVRIISNLSTKLSKEVSQNFHRACVHIDHMLNQRRKVNETAFGKNGAALGTVEEHGMMFSCLDDKAVETRYWVVGRAFANLNRANTPTTDQFYVCFLEGTIPKMVEMAFKLKGHFF